MYKYYNPNPGHFNTGDCVVRGISKLMSQSWEWTYMMICIQGFLMKKMPSYNEVWSEYLFNNGYRRTQLPNTCPDCYIVKDFCHDFPIGRYLLALDGHVVAVVDGNYYDTWDSGNETVLYYWRREQ